MSQAARPGPGRQRSEMPRYVEIAGALRQEIGHGRWRPGERLPAITDLAVQFRTTPVTARQAVKLLEARGAVECRRGSGTYVTGAPLPLRSLTLGADLRAIAARIEQGETREIAPLDASEFPAAVPAGLRPAPAYKRFCRLSLRAGQPFMVSDVFLDRRVAREHRASLAAGLVLPVLMRSQGRGIRRASQVLTIEMANGPVNAHLQLPQYMAVARLEVALRDRAGVAVYVGALYWPADFVRVEFDV